MKFEVSVLATAIALSGCAMTQRVTEIELEKGRTAVFRLPASVFTGDLTSIAASYATALERSSSYTSINTKEGISQGVQISYSHNTATISYVRQSVHSNLKNNYSAQFRLNQLLNGDTYTVTVDCPSTMVNDLSSLTIPWSPLIQADEAAADIKAICTKAELTFQVTENGEINTPFNDASVFANFNRKLKSYSTQYAEIGSKNLNKSKWFLLQDNNMEYKIAVTVFPYRNGSKVVYSNVRFVKCKASQGCEFDPTFAERLKEKLTDIAND